MGALRIIEGQRGIFGRPETMRPYFAVERPYRFAGQDIVERLAEFDTREEAEAYVAAQNCSENR